MATPIIAPISLDDEPVVTYAPDRLIVTDADGSELELRPRGSAWRLSVGRRQTEAIDLTDAALMAMASRIGELVSAGAGDAVARIRDQIGQVVIAAPERDCRHLLAAMDHLREHLRSAS